MQVTVREQTQEILLSTVSLIKNGTNVYLFHCYNCATSLLKIQGNVASIDAGLVPTSHVVVINQCHRCKRNYTFQSTTRTTTKITLTVSYNPENVAFHCVICRFPLVRYNADAAVILPNKVVEEFPETFTCSNPSCKRQYQLNEIVYQ